jgi:hypothetical protein
VSINQQALIKLEYADNIVTLDLPSDYKLTGVNYSVNTIGQGLNTTTIKLISPTKKINGDTLANISNTSLVKILDSGNKLDTYYAPLNGVGVHFDASALADSNTKYSIPYSSTFDLKSVASCYLLKSIYGIEAIGIKLYGRDKGYDVDPKLVISFYDSSDAFIFSSPLLNIRPTTNTVNGYGMNCMVSLVPANAKFARIGFLNSANYNAKFPDHGEPIAFSVFALGSTEFKTNPVTRVVIV